MLLQKALFFIFLFCFLSCQNTHHTTYTNPIDSLSVLLNQDSLDIDLLNSRAKLYFNSNQLHLAKKDIDKSYHIFKNDVNLLLNRGDIYYALNKTRIAKESWERCLKIDPNQLDCRQKLTELLCAVRSPNCKSMIDTIVLINRGVLSPSLIVYLKELGEYESAINLLETLIVQFPEEKEYLSLLSILYSDTISINKKYNLERAEYYFQRIIQLYPSYSRAYYNFGKHKQNIFKYQEALMLYNKSIQLDNLNKQTYYNMGFCSMQIEEYNQAIIYFSNAINLDNTFLLAYHARAYLYSLIGELEKSKLDWKQCLMLNPSYIPALEALSQ